MKWLANNMKKFCFKLLIEKSMQSLNKKQKIAINNKYNFWNNMYRKLLTASQWAKFRLKEDYRRRTKLKKYYYKKLTNKNWEFSKKKEKPNRKRENNNNAELWPEKILISKSLNKQNYHKNILIDWYLISLS